MTGVQTCALPISIRMNHPRIGPEHLLKALMEDDQCMSSGLIRACGGNVEAAVRATDAALAKIPQVSGGGANQPPGLDNGSEEHTSELQSLMRISYAVFCLKKKKKHQ